MEIRLHILWNTPGIAHVSPGMKMERKILYIKRLKILLTGPRHFRGSKATCGLAFVSSS